MSYLFECVSLMICHTAWHPVLI